MTRLVEPSKPKLEDALRILCGFISAAHIKEKNNLCKCCQQVFPCESHLMVKAIMEQYL